MMKDWHVVGQAVVCRIQAPTSMQMMFPEITFPQKDERYTIREVMIGQNNIIGFRLEEIINTKYNTESTCGGYVLLGECAWTSSEFEPIVSRPTSIECFEKIIQEVSRKTPILVP